MTATDQQKVLALGFMIIRPDAQNLRIKYKGPESHEWRCLEKGFKNKSRLEKRTAELLINPMTVQD